MTQFNPYQIIKSRIVTEKTMSVKRSQKAASGVSKVVFRVCPTANKIEIKQAFEAIYNVKVKKVCTLTMLPKTKRTKYGLGKTSGGKKAIITPVENVPALAGL